MNTVSVITVVLNDVKNIESTIQSVLSQKECDIEYIVIDGGSVDGTIDVVNKYRDRIAYFHSERDAGIYDAMNKGCRVAANTWVIFMNSGDRFVSDRAVCDAMSAVQVGDDVLYGGYWVDYGVRTKRLVRPGETRDLWKKPLTSHQAIFVRTELMKTHQFDSQFSLAADHALISKLHFLGCNFRLLPYTIACVSAAGLSDIRRSRVFREFSEIAKTFYPEKPYRSYFFWKMLDGQLRAFIKKIIPSSLILRLQLRGETSKQECER